jgi:hypothetical protein
MLNGARSFTGFAVALAAALVCGQAVAQTAPPAGPAAGTCCTPQSPRSLTPADWNYTSQTSAVYWRDANSINYELRPGVHKILHLCSQHYHCHIENVQECNKESAAPAGGESACPAEPPVGSWIEVHTAYHDAPAVIPTPEDLGSCDLKTVVVVGYHARVTKDSIHLPTIPIYFGPPAAEWSGSSTGPDKPPVPECKVAAFWHFALGCDFKLGQQLLVEDFHHPEEARGLQPPNRVSKDLTHIPAGKKHPTKPQTKPQ